jgi:hypothetical protein
MARKKPIVGYAVYWPPVTGLPYLAVTFLPDGTVDARQFDNAEGAEAYSADLSKGLKLQSIKH